MEKVQSDTILNAFEWRYDNQDFNPKKEISQRDLKTLFESLRLAPSSYGLQPYKFIVVQSKKIRKKLQEDASTYSDIISSPHLIVVASLNHIKESYINHFFNEISRIRSTSIESLSNFKAMITNSVNQDPLKSNIPAWTSCQAHIAVGMFIATAALLKIDAHNVLGANHKECDRILNLTNSEYQTCAILLAGYRPDNTPHKASSTHPEQKIVIERQDIVEVIS